MYKLAVRLNKFVCEVEQIPASEYLTWTNCMEIIDPLPPEVKK